MLLTLVPDPAMGATEALEGVVSLLSHEVSGTFVERGSNRREARECIEGYDGAAVEQLRFLQSGAEGYAAHGGDQGERAQQTVSAPSPASLAPLTIRFQDPSKAIEVGAENHEHLVAKIVNALQDKNLEHLYVPFAPEVQINVIAATFTILRALTSLKQSFSRHEHAFKVTNPGYANLGIMSLVSVFSKEGSPDNTIAVGSDNILSLTLPFGQVHDRCDEDNCGLVFPEQNISLDKLDLEALTHLGSRPTMLRELDLLGTFDLHQTPITTGRKVRPNKRAKAAGDNAEEDLIGTFIAWISQRGLVPT
ncbi:hypothetical protein D6D20_02525 [Aureobasidium pullulans]|uniref:Uncharacterized protein n=1 Tax=Aureobasidium pullulans TaxID=5580 RepID=A0A4S8ZG70_AURPU|nr:hypothetical protein D6D20_02525 [Aureobasidium pullulans]